MQNRPVAGLKEQAKHLATKEELTKGLRDLERELKNDILGVKDDLHRLDRKMDKGCDDLKSLVEVNVLANENKILKKIIGWGLGIFTAGFSALVFLLSQSPG